MAINASCTHLIFNFKIVLFVFFQVTFPTDTKFKLPKGKLFIGDLQAGMNSKNVLTNNNIGTVVR